jgi:hypothetical protein
VDSTLGLISLKCPDIRPLSKSILAHQEIQKMQLRLLAKQSLSDSARSEYAAKEISRKEFSKNSTL